MLKRMVVCLDQINDRYLPLGYTCAFFILGGV
ncbi:hypothetical protein XM79_c20437 [Vibrio vulnificus]|nr:hypothetical protein XM74_c20256 [Vibrio vulnificus]OQK50093.1 hypothetical protein XM76_c20362 [Vibrio vulnificus]OQK60519.1 hypothetical protein XM78_c20438 [Vibrio vulnificus]OQK63245.1 hypothetical protein XM79_c20437 [Vibrio vulnificus]